VNTDEQVKAMMRELGRIAKETAGMELELPPPSVDTFKTEYVFIEEGVRLRARSPWQKQFANPTGVYQGGALAGAFDNVFGPLSYLSLAKAAATLDLSVSFMRPFLEKDSYVEIEARVVLKTKTLVFMDAEARTPDGRLIATAKTHSIVIGPSK
jgi:uncharacterized protein (TIGR00369 family)